MDRDTDDVSSKAEQKNQHQQSIKKYYIRRSTLQDRISGRVTHGTKPGPRPYLTAEEEESLTTHLLM